ncbi:MAG: hypothetical protein R8G66_08570 [Cytophagales bacterium]|nr:hypothetical protein [Cytophagales bacterium]
MKNFLWLLILGVSTMSGLTSCETDFDEIEQKTEVTTLKNGDGNNNGSGNGGGIPPGGG